VMSALEQHATLRAPSDSPQRDTSVPFHLLQTTGGSRPYREQQLVVVAARERSQYRIFAARFEPGARLRIDRQSVGIDHDADPAGLGDAVHAVGESVAQVDARGGRAIAREHHTESHTRLRPQISSGKTCDLRLVTCDVTQLSEARRRRSDHPAYVDL